MSIKIRNSKSVTGVIFTYLALLGTILVESFRNQDKTSLIIVNNSDDGSKEIIVKVEEK